MSTANGSARTRTRKVADKPASVALNLDQLGREGSEYEPFVFVLGGRPLTMIDPHAMDWQEAAAAINDPRMMFRLALAEDDHEFFITQKVSIRQINTLVETYLRHYGWDEDQLGKLRASQF